MKQIIWDEGNMSLANCVYISLISYSGLYDNFEEIYINIIGHPINMKLNL